MNVIAGLIGGVVEAILTLTARLIIAHPLACAAGLAALVALVKGVPAPVVIVALVAAAVVGDLRKKAP